MRVLVLSISDRVVVLDYGRVIAQGPPSAVAADPAVIEAYLGRGGPDMAPTPPTLGPPRRSRDGPRPPAMSPLLEISDLHVSYGQRRALAGVSLTVGPGEIVTLLGANGSGKSTTLRAVSGLVRASRGALRYDGRDLARWPADAIVAAGVSHVPEGRDVFAEFSVLENLLVGAHTVGRAEVQARLEAVHALFPVLRERRRQRAGTLSCGEQQMLAIGRALMTRPRLLLLDEPSLGLAPRLMLEIFAVIRRINAEGVAVLLVEQNARAALARASRGYVLETGRVVAEGTSAALAGDPRIRAAYLGLDPAPVGGQGRYDAGQPRERATS